jgi:hypothetical protein
MKNGILALCFLLLAACEAQAPERAPVAQPFHGEDMDVPEPGFSPDFRLKDADGRKPQDHRYHFDILHF